MPTRYLHTNRYCSLETREQPRSNNDRDDADRGPPHHPTTTLSIRTPKRKTTMRLLIHEETILNHIIRNLLNLIIIPLAHPIPVPRRKLRLAPIRARSREVDIQPLAREDGGALARQWVVPGRGARGITAAAAGVEGHRAPLLLRLILLIVRPVRLAPVAEEAEASYGCVRGVRRETVHRDALTDVQIVIRPPGIVTSP